MKIFVFLFLLVISIGASGESWREYKSDNFLVYSDHKPEEIKQLVKNFETYRKAVLMFFGLTDIPENTRAKIYVFDSEREFGLLDFGSRVAGVFINDYSGPLMVVGSFDKFRDSQIVLFHEYVHYLTRERSNLLFPRWYSEGVADLLGAAVVEDGTVSIGNSNPWRHRRSSRGARTHVKALIEPPEITRYKYHAYFYPSSWILTHYLYFSSLQGGVDYSVKLKKYLNAYQQGNDGVETFEGILGVDVEKLDSAVDAYSKKGSLVGFKIPVGQYEGDVEVKPLSSNQSIYVRSKLLLSVEEEYKARHFLKKTQDGKEFSAINNAMYAVGEASRGKLNVADKKMSAALKEKPKDLEIQEQLINYRYHVLKQLKEDKKWDEELYSQTIVEGKATIDKLKAKDQASIYLSEVYRLGEEHKESLKLLMSVYQNHSRSIRLNERIALYLIDINSPQLAKPFLTNIINFTHSPKIRERAEKLMDKYNIK